MNNELIRDNDPNSQWTSNIDAMRNAGVFLNFAQEFLQNSLNTIAVAKLLHLDRLLYVPKNAEGTLCVISLEFLTNSVRFISQNDNTCINFISIYIFFLSKVFHKLDPL
jgi:hypothetical protein